MIQRKYLALLLALLLTLSLAACGESKDKKAKKSAKTATEVSTELPAESTTAAAAAKEKLKDYVADDVELPKLFDNMIYPLEALMVQDYVKGYAYYSEETTDEEGDSFWLSMAVLTSLMEKYASYGDANYKDGYYYLEEDVIDMYATALYGAIGAGDLEFPELAEEDAYAVYDETNETYGFLKGTVSTVTPYITACTQTGDTYILTAELRKIDGGDVARTYEITIEPTTFSEIENHFEYSVTAMQSPDEVDSYEATEETTEAESTTETTETTEASTTETTEATEAETAEENTKAFDEEIVTTEKRKDKTESTKQKSDQTGSGGISQEDALALAKSYYGEDATYAYKTTVTVGDKSYYDFSVKGDGVTGTDVLVSTDGEDVLGGTKNADGTWSFDQ